MRDRLTPGFEAFGRERQGGRVKERKHDLSLNQQVRQISPCGSQRNADLFGKVKSEEVSNYQQSYFQKITLSLLPHF